LLSFLGESFCEILFSFFTKTRNFRESFCANRIFAPNDLAAIAHKKTVNLTIILFGKVAVFKFMNPPSPRQCRMVWKMKIFQLYTLINSRIYGYVRGNTINLSTKCFPEFKGTVSRAKRVCSPHQNFHPAPDPHNAGAALQQGFKKECPIDTK
jgi:hypothetical protein